MVSRDNKAITQATCQDIRQIGEDLIINSGQDGWSVLLIDLKRQSATIPENMRCPNCHHRLREVADRTIKMVTEAKEHNMTVDELIFTVRWIKFTRTPLGKVAQWLLSLFGPPKRQG